MTTLVQNVPNQTFSAATTVPFTVSATSAGNLGVVELASGAGSQYTSFTVADNAAGGSSTWVTEIVRANNQRLVGVARCLSLKAGVTTVTLTPSGGTGGIYGAAAFQEVNASGTWSLDQSNSAGGTANTGATVTNGSSDVGTTDFVVGAYCTGNGINPANIQNPAATGYSTGAVQQDDSGASGGQCSYRINSSAVTDSISWTCTNSAAGDPAVLVSYQNSGTSGGGTAAIAWVKA